MKGKLIDWKDIQDKPFKILLSDLPHAITLMRKVGFDIEEVNGQYWLRVNFPKDKEG